MSAQNAIARAANDEGQAAHHLDALLADPSRVGQVPVERLPALLSQLASAQSQLAALEGAIAARLVTTTVPLAAPATTGLLDVHDAAQRLGMSVDWMYRNSKRLPFTRRVGTRAVKFDPDGLARWVAAQRRA